MPILAIVVFGLHRVSSVLGTHQTMCILDGQMFCFIESLCSGLAQTRLLLENSALAAIHGIIY
jgi:hypothetical protein